MLHSKVCPSCKREFKTTVKRLTYCCIKCSTEDTNNLNKGYLKPQKADVEGFIAWANRNQERCE